MAFILAWPTVAAKELWNTVAPLDDSSEASAAVLAAVSSGYGAFRDAETNGVEARKVALKAAGDDLLGASNLMFSNAELIKGAEVGFVPIDYNRINKDSVDLFESWLALNGQKTPSTPYDLYFVAAEETKDLGEKFLEWSTRDDDDVFSEFITRTAGYMQAGWVGSRIFEATLAE